MTRIFYGILSVVVMFAMSCVRVDDEIMSVTDDDVDMVSADDYAVKGWVRIKLNDDADELRVGAFTRGSVDTGDPELDEVAEMLGATEVRRVFGTDERFTARHRRYGLHLWYDMKIDKSISVTRAGEELAGVPGIAHVQPIYKIRPTGFESGGLAVAAGEGNRRTMPFDDPLLSWQWHYDNDGSLRGAVAGADVGLFDAWETLGYGDPSVIVAVMDTGIDCDHEDLRNNMWTNTGEIPGNGIDDDNNGVVDDIHGANYSIPEPTGTIEYGVHGTHVAGTIAAENANGIGVCGVAGGSGKGDGVRIMCVQVYDPEGMNDFGINVDGFRYAADNGAVISNNSWTYSYAIGIPADFAVAVDYFMDNAGMADMDGDGINDVQTGPMQGGAVFFCVGNEAKNEIGIPAYYDRIIAVTSMMPDYRMASYSNYGRDADLFAPGGAGNNDKGFDMEGQVLSIYPNNEYGYISGTSMACPHVSGMAALVVSRYGVGKPGFTADDLRERLLASYRYVASYQDSEAIAEGIGRGLLDGGLVSKAGQTTAPAAPERVSAVAEVERQMAISIDVPADGNGMAVAGFHIEYAREGASEWIPIDVDNYCETGETVKYVIEGLGFETFYEFRIYSVDRYGVRSQSPAECSGTTLAHANLRPEVLQMSTRLEFPSNNGAFSANLNLAKYISDPDEEEFGDVLTYSVAIDDESIVGVNITGASMSVRALKEGETAMIVTGTDKAGAFARCRIKVVVTEAPPTGTPPTEDVEGVVVIQNRDTDALELYIGGASSGEALLEAYDAAARKAVDERIAIDESGHGTVTVGDIAPGLYTAKVRYAGKYYECSLVWR